MSRSNEIGLDDLASERWGAVVIGAGPAGGVTALQLGRLGVRTLLVDKRSFPRFKVCGCCLNRRSLAMFDRVGLRSELAGHGGPKLASVSIHYRGRNAQLPIPGGMAVSRAAMDQLVVDSAIAAGVGWIPETTASVDSISGDGDPSDARFVSLKDANGSTRRIEAAVVVVADGLGHPSLSRLNEFADDISPTSRIGIGGSFAGAGKNAHVPPGQIQMIVGRDGYVGLVQAEDSQVQVAAAVDATMLSGERTPLDAVSTLMAEAGVEPPEGLQSGVFKGTLPLTRSINHVADERLFVLGDATGYVEPFTGEGMAWALSSAVGLAPILKTAVEQWDTKLADQWTATHKRLVRRRQRSCHRVARLLRSPAMLGVAMPVLEKLPWTTRRLIREMNATPQELVNAR